MNAKSLRLQIISEINDLQDINILKKIKSILSAEQKDWWDELSEEEKASLDRGLKQIENGQILTQQQVKNRFLKS